MTAAYLRDAICRLFPVSVDDEHIRANQQSSAPLQLFPQYRQLFRQPDIVLVAVGEILAFRLFREALECPVGAEVLLVARDCPREAVDTRFHAPLNLREGHRRRAVVADIQPQI